MKLRHYIRSFFQLSPDKGYDLWAPHYESDNNLMHVLDRALVEYLISDLDLRDKNILDFGCGTGRYWPLLKMMGPAKIVGCDASAAMLSQLRKKDPGAEVYQTLTEKLPFQPDRSIDLIFSTLTIGHLEKLDVYFAEWDRVLRPGGHLLITGNHPTALKQGIKRSFSINGRSFIISNVIHDIDEVLALADTLAWQKLEFAEKNIAEDHYPYFRAAGADKSYRRMHAKPVVYGLLLQKAGR